MSNALAIATVTQTLLNVLTEALVYANVPGAVVTAVRPDDPTQLPATGVNIFLYQVAPNTALRNSDLPTRTADGTLLQRPQAALDLYYLITFYGADAQLEQQRLLGAVTLALHAQPWLRISDILAAQATPFLAGADLADQSERVRFRPVSFSLEELSKLWSFLLKTDYVLSAAYVASVVLIDLPVPTPAPALPVRTPVLLTVPFQLPVITAITATSGPPNLILPGAQINLTGTNLLGPAGTETVVLVGGTNLMPAPNASATSLTITLPATLAAGAQTAQVVQQPLLGSPPVAHGGGVQSMPAPFVLSPLIRHSGSPPVYQIAVAIDTGSPPADTVTVSLDPAVQTGQRSVLALLPQAPGALPTLFDGGTATAPTNTVVFTIGFPPAGNYFVQVIVAGAESPLDTDASGLATGPVITL
jgi:Pvc16 N-terminal domain